MSTRAQVAVLVVAAILAGAGIGALVVTLTRDNGGGTTTTQFTTTVGPSAAASAAAPGTTTPVPASNPSLDRAVAGVQAKGYNVEDSGSYNPDQRLSVLIGVLKGSADGTAQKAFFFADGRFIGTDTADQSANILVANQSDDEIGLRYALYKARDPQCCPTDGAVIVNYQWTGSSLRPLQAIPPSSYRVDNSRR